MDATGINLNRLAVFAALVRAGSFTAAAEKLGMTKSMVSQHLARLEKELGVSLLLRTTRRMVLTEAGAAFHADCETLLADAEAAIRRVGADRATPSGTLRVTAAGDYGPAVVAPALASFVRRFPQVRAELVATDRIADPIAERFDVAIRVGWLRDSSLRATRLAAFRQRLVAAPAHLDEHGTPRRPEDLARQSWVELTALASPLRWTFTAADGARRVVRMRATIQANSTLAVRALLRAGAGYSVLPDYLADEDVQAGRLLHVLPRWRLPDGGIHAVYPDRQPPAKVRAFIDHLREALPREG